MTAPLRHDPVARAVDHTLVTIMRGMLSARRAGWCPVCDAPTASPYLPDEMIAAPRITSKERQRRRDVDRRVTAILHGECPR